MTTKKKVSKKVVEKKPEIELPPMVRKTDMKYVSTHKPQYEKGNYGRLQLWYTERFGWCITTLLISKSRRGSDYQDRYYGINLKGQEVRIGKGPHVLHTIEIRLTDKNIDRLKDLVELYEKGLAAAGETRDTISTRRMRRKSYFNF